MVSASGPNSDRRDNTAVTGLICGVILMVTAACLSIFVQTAHVFLKEPIAQECPKSQAQKWQQSETNCQNERSVRAAELAAFSALWQLLFNLIGLIGLGLTVLYARRAWKASERGVSETRRIGEAQVRAYLSVTEAWIAFGETGIPYVRINIRNAGQSPARHFWWSFRIAYLSATSGVFNQGFEMNRQFPTGNVIGVDEPFIGRPVTISSHPNEAIRHAMAGEEPINAMVRVTLQYQDVFDDWQIDVADLQYFGPFVADVEQPLLRLLEGGKPGP